MRHTPQGEPVGTRPYYQIQAPFTDRVGDFDFPLDRPLQHRYTLHISIYGHMVKQPDGSVQITTAPGTVQPNV